MHLVRDAFFEAQVGAGLIWKVFGGTGILPVWVHRLESLCHQCSFRRVRLTHHERMPLAGGTPAPRVGGGQGGLRHRPFMPYG